METLLDRLRAREPGAFEEALTRYGPPLHRAVGQLLRDAAAAEDVVQETFARLFQSMGDVRELRPWLFRVALNLAHSTLRRRAVATRAEPRPPATAEGPDPELAGAVAEALDRLPEGCRTAFVLREVAGLTTAEAAEASGCSEEALRQRLLDARRRLRSALSVRFRSPDFKGV